MAASKKALQQFLKDRGIQYAGYKKEELVAMCKLASDTKVDVDPDGLNYDIGNVIAMKLQSDNGDYLAAPSICEGS
jgi:hypothetical protein